MEKLQSKNSRPIGKIYFHAEPAIGKLKEDEIFVRHEKVRVNKNDQKQKTVIPYFQVFNLNQLISFYNLRISNNEDFSIHELIPANTACNFFVDSDSSYKFCCEKLKVKYFENGSKVSNDFTCNQLLNKSFVKDLKILDCSGVGCP